ncbi:MAG TPA: glycosyl hydrolase family 28 protein [Sphingomonas sp.]|nr:glycosyl hydrolase family 28 protein [Sphingomonas sp.]
MSPRRLTRRRFALTALVASVFPAVARAAAGREAGITDFGARADGTTVNTRAIQATIDHLARSGGGTVVVPQGVFVSGALFLKPGVHLRFEQGAVIRCSTDMENFPRQRTRIEGHFEEAFTPALINARGCHGLRISGPGTLDGAGRPIWDEFWKQRNAAPDPGEFPNIGLPRARLALIENSRGVTVDGVTFKDSQFWNLHIYDCEEVLVRNARFEVPDDYKQAPSSDGIDLDSCRKVTIDGCYFSVTDDCIAAKGSKGPFALQDKSSPPVENIRVRNCHFRRGHQAFACGSEATIIRDVIIEDCRVTGNMVLTRLKLRPDTPQHYENITLRNITLDNEGGTILAIQPWSQYKDLRGEAPPQSVVRNVRLVGIKGRFGSFGTIRPNPGQTTISDILLQDIDVTLRDGKLAASGVSGLRFENVVVNGRRVTS